MKKLVHTLGLLAAFASAIAPASAALAQTLGDTAAAMSASGVQATKSLVPVPAALNASAAPAGAPAATASPGAAVPAAAPVGAAPQNAVNTMNAVNAIDPSGMPAAPTTMAPGGTPGVIAGNAYDVPPPEAAIGGLDDPFRQSFFFSPVDLIGIERAVKGSYAANGPGGPGSQGEKIPMVRKITLSGVAFKNPKQWVVWINGQKISPGYLLKEIVDIQVEQDAVHLKWFDIGLNGVLNITLHPHETYDIVAGVLLPG